MPDEAYVFSKPITVPLQEVDALDDVAQQQFLIGAAAYSGESYDDVPTCIPKLIEQFEEGELERYAIHRAGEAAPVYEMWVFNSDNGVVFPVGSPEPTAVHCTQSHFWSVDDNDKIAIALAEQLEENVPF